MSTRLTTILAATALTITLTGCGEDEAPTVADPPAAEETSESEAPEPAPTTEEPAPTSEAAPTTEAPTSEAAPTTEEAEPTSEAPEGDLPTDPSAYGDLFVQAWADQDQELLEQLAGPGVLTSMELWGGQGWARGEVRQEAHGAVVIEYSDQENMHVELWVQEGITQAGEPHGVVEAVVSEGSFPLPDTVEDYATAFVDTAGGDVWDREYLERLGTPEAVAEAQDWFRNYTWGTAEVSDGPDEGTARVTFPAQDSDVQLVLMVDRELAESGSEDAVLSAELDDGSGS